MPAATTDLGLVLYGVMIGVFISVCIINAWRFGGDDED